MFRTASKSNLALGVALAVIMMCGVPSTHCMRVVGTQSDALTADNVDLFSKFIRRITGAESLNKEYQGYQTGRQEIMERRSYALGAGLAVLIITALSLWALTFYAWWRLRLIRRQGHGQVPIQPMMAPMIHAISPQPLPSGPKLVSQKVIGNAPPGFHPSPVRVH